MRETIVTREAVRREVVVTREGIEMQRHSYLQHSHVVVTREGIESQMHSYLQHSHTVSTHIPLQYLHTSSTHTVQHIQQGRVTCFTIHPHHWYCTHTDQCTFVVSSTLRLPHHTLVLCTHRPVHTAETGLPEHMTSRSRTA